MIHWASPKCLTLLWPKNVVEITKSGMNRYSIIELNKYYRQAKFIIYDVYSVQEDGYFKFFVTPSWPAEQTV